MAVAGVNHYPIIDPAAVGLGINIFVEITLERQNDNTLRAFEKDLADDPWAGDKPDATLTGA